MRIKPSLSESLEDILDELKVLYPGRDVQELMATALYRNVLRNDLFEMIDWIILADDESVKAA